MIDNYYFDDTQRRILSKEKHGKLFTSLSHILTMCLCIYLHTRMQKLARIGTEAKNIIIKNHYEGILKIHIV